MDGTARGTRTPALVALASLALAGVATAQAPANVLVRSWDEGSYGALAANRGAVGVWQRMLKLRTTASVLYTASHPDDEEAGVLTLLSRGRGVRTALLTLNRGEGGANALGPELFDALGLVRTEELRLAGRYYGLDDQYFTTAVDYGYSKTLDEALRSWDREALLEDMVRIIRTNRPLVVVSRWHGSTRDGHGHHQAAGVLTPEAVRAAADPRRFPDQIAREGLRAWRVPKVYRGRLQGGETWNVELAPHVASPWLGASYQDLGSYGLSLQRSQTAGRLRGGGAAVRYERLTSAGPDREDGLFAGLDVTWSGVFAVTGEPEIATATAALAAAEAAVDAAFGAFHMSDPTAAAPHLARARADLASALDAMEPAPDAAFLVALELRELDAALSAALGLELEAVATRAGGRATDPMGPAVPGQELTVHLALGVSGTEPVGLEGVTIETDSRWRTLGSVPATRLEPGAEASGTLSLHVPPAAEPTRPWFHRTSIADNAYSVRDSSEIHLGESRPPARAVARVTYAGETIDVSAPVRTIAPEAPYGTARHPLVVSPALSVLPAARAVVVTPGTDSVTIVVDVVSNAPDPVAAVVEVDPPAGWASTAAAHPVELGRTGEAVRVGVRVAVAATSPTRGALRVRARAAGRSYGEGYRVVDHRDLAPSHLYEDATVELVPVDVTIAPGLRVGYVMGVGDEVPAAIAQVGADVELLGEADLAAASLGAYDAIVVGTRAYAVRPDLAASNRRLLEYARSGGHLIVLYQTQEYTPETQAPYPASLPGDAQEVSEEDAPVTVLAPAHPLLTTPNRIVPADFDGWIEQRGSKHFASWSPEYTPLIETHDTGQDPQEGVWLHAAVGDGDFTYASIALHRQLPYGVPGAYRILANLLSLGR